MWSPEPRARSLRSTSRADACSGSPNVGDARAVEASRTEVWVVARTELVALEKEGLKEAARIPIEGVPCSVAVEGNRVLVSGSQPLMTEVDATTHRVSR